MKATVIALPYPYLTEACAAVMRVEMLSTSEKTRRTSSNTADGVEISSMAFHCGTIGGDSKGWKVPRYLSSQAFRDEFCEVAIPAINQKRRYYRDGR